MGQPVTGQYFPHLTPPYQLYFVGINKTPQSTCLSTSILNLSSSEDKENNQRDNLNQMASLQASKKISAAIRVPKLI